MTEKRERRCETCAAWNEGGHSAIGCGTCQVHSPTEGTPFTSTSKGNFCIADYIPLDMVNGVPDADELLTRIQNSEGNIKKQRKRAWKLEERVDELESNFTTGMIYMDPFGSQQAKISDLLHEVETDLVSGKVELQPPGAESAICGNCDHWCDTLGPPVDPAGDERFGGCTARKSIQRGDGSQYGAEHWAVTMPLMARTGSCEQHTWKDDPVTESKPESPAKRNVRNCKGYISTGDDQ